jgi:hypothetical protein
MCFEQLVLKEEKAFYEGILLRTPSPKMNFGSDLFTSFCRCYNFDFSSVMNSCVMYMTFAVLQFFAVVGEGANLRNRVLEADYNAFYYDVANSSDITSTSYDTSNSTVSTLRDKVLQSYMTSPDEWQTNEWAIFAFIMFLFGSLSSVFFMCFVLPCCCPAKARTAYARCIAPKLVEEDPKKVRLIKV